MAPLCSACFQDLRAVHADHVPARLSGGEADGTPDQAHPDDAERTLHCASLPFLSPRPGHPSDAGLEHTFSTLAHNLRILLPHPDPLSSSCVSRRTVPGTSAAASPAR